MPLVAEKPHKNISLYNARVEEYLLEQQQTGFDLIISSLPWYNTKGEDLLRTWRTAEMYIESLRLLGIHLPRFVSRLGYIVLDNGWNKAKKGGDPSVTLRAMDEFKREAQQWGLICVERIQSRLRCESHLWVFTAEENPSRHASKISERHDWFNLPRRRMPHWTQKEYKAMCKLFTTHTTREQQVREQPNYYCAKMGEYLINRFTFEGASVFNPFSGSGTFGAICTDWGLQYTGVECNKAIFEGSRFRLKLASQKTDPSKRTVHTESIVDKLTAEHCETYASPSRIEAIAEKLNRKYNSRNVMATS